MDLFIAWVLAVGAFGLSALFLSRRARKLDKERSAQQRLVLKLQTAQGGRPVDQTDLIDTRTILGLTKDEWLIAGSALFALATLAYALVRTFLPDILPWA